ncbi:unnamed protein product [Closterium sp. NIES-54]
MTLRPSTAPQSVPLPSPPASSLPVGPDPESDSLRAASPTVTRFLATADTDPLFESSAASALVAELVEFAAACRLDYAASLVAESVSASVCPPSVGGECALGTDILEDRQEDLECFAAASPHLVPMLLAPEGDPDALDIPTPRSYAEAIEGPYSSQWQATMDAEMASWKSTGTYVDEFPPPGANIVSGMWIFRVKRPPGSPPAFKARYVARGFSQRQGVDFFQTFSPTPKMTTLWFPDATELPRWADLLRKNIDILALDFDAILGAMYALTISVEGDCYLSVPPDPGIGTSETAPPGASASAALGPGEAAALGTRKSTVLGLGEAAALGASESAPPGASASALAGTASTEALHTFTLDLGASRCFFRDRTALEQLAQPVAVSLADPSGGRVIATSTVLPCPAVPSGTLSGLYLPSFSTNLPGSDLYTLTTESPQVAASASASGQLSAPCSCRSLSHQTVLWHHRLGHPSVQRLRGMHSRYLVSGLPMVLPPLPPSPAPPCLPCVEGQQRAAPHSFSFPPTEAPLQTLHLDMWGPARVRGQGHERYFLLVVDDYTSYTTVFPLRTKGEVPDVLIPWICAARLQLRDRFQSDFPVLRLHSDRGGEFSSDLLAAYCAEHGIHQTFTLPASPHQNGVAECRIGLVMEITRTSLIHAAAPHFLWPFAVQYAAHQLNLWPRVSAPETSPTLLWTGQVGDASRFRVLGARAFIRDTTADKLSAHAVPCVFLGFVPDAPGWQFYHPTSRRVFPSQDVTFDESVPFYRLFPYRTAPLPPPPLFLTLGAPPVDPLPPEGPAPSGVSQVDVFEPVEVAVDSGPERGTEPEGTEPGGVETEGAETGGGEPGGAATGGAAPLSTEPRGTAAGGAEPGGVEPRVTEPGGVDPVGAPSSQQLREWYARRCSLRGGAPSFELPPARGLAAPGGAAGATGGSRAVGGAAGAAGGATGAAGGAAGAARGTGATGGAAGAAGGTGAAGAPSAAPGPGTGGAAGGTDVDTPEGATSAAGVGAAAGGSGAVSAGSGGMSRPRPYFVTLLQQVLSRSPPPCPAPSLECPSPVRLQSLLRPTSPLPGPSPYTGPTGGLTERREPESRPRPPAVPGTHQMLLRLSTAPRRVPLPSPPASYLPALADPESESLRGASPAVTRLLSTVVIDPSFALVAASESVCPPSVRGECALGTDVLEDRQEEFECFATAVPHLVSMLIAPEGDPDAPDIPTPRSYAEAIAGEYSSQWQTAMDTEMASWKSTGTYVNEVPPPGANIGVDFFHTFSPTPKMTTLRVLLHVAAQRDYELHSLEFSTAFLQGSLHEEIWLRRPPGFTGSFPPGTQWSLRRPVYGLRQAPREWHDTLRTTLAALGFSSSTANPSLFLRTDTSLPPFYILVYVDNLVFAIADTEALAHVKSELQKRHTCTDLALPSDESVEPSGPYPVLVGCLMYLMTCTRPDLAYPLGLLARYVAPGRHRKVHWDAAKRVLRYLCSTSGMGLVLGGRRSVVLTGHSDASWVDDQATQRSSQGYTFSLGSGSVSWRSTRSSSVLSSSCEAEIYATAMAAQELRWLTYLLTDLGERPSSPPVLYVDNKAAIALCQEHRLEHRTKHIALRYFLARELQQRGQLCLRYVATRANIADIFTKALQPGDHQRFCTVLGLVPTVPHLLLCGDVVIHPELALSFLTALPREPRTALSTAMAPEAWYMDDKSDDQRLPHRLDPNQPCSLETLSGLGILYWKLDADIWESDPELKQIRKDRNYSYEEVVNIHPDTLPNYEQKLKSFYEEHIHTDEEIRYILDGSGYFDVRDFEDRWIRIHTKKGDLVVLPAGIYHRFTLDSTNYVKALRLFVGEPVWTPYNRPADEMAARKEYLEKFAIRTATAVA